jgi:hypothetical protein
VEGSGDCCDLKYPFSPFLLCFAELDLDLYLLFGFLIRVAFITHIIEILEG